MVKKNEYVCFHLIQWIKFEKFNFSLEDDNNNNEKISLIISDNKNAKG